MAGEAATERLADYRRGHTIRTAAGEEGEEAEEEDESSGRSGGRCGRGGADREATAGWSGPRWPGRGGGAEEQTRLRRVCERMVF